MALPPVMASGLLSPEDVIMTENPYSGLFAEPANNFTFLPIAKTESGRFRPAVPQFVQSMYDASLGDDGVGGVAADMLFGDEPVSGDRMFDAALNYGAEVMAPQSAATLAVRPSGNTLSALSLAKQDRIIKEYNKLADQERIDKLYTSLKNRGDIIGTDVRSQDVGELVPKNTLGLLDLEGDYLLPLYADRTSTLKQIDQIDGESLAYPIITDGGKDFMRRTDTEGVWASEPVAISRLRGAVNRANEAGVDPYGVYLAMGGDGLDFSTMPLDTVISRMPYLSNVISKDAIKDFDEYIRTAEVTDASGKKRKIDPNWKGINDPDIRDYIKSDIDGTTRALIMKELAKDRRQKEGFPDVARIRRALTDDSLLETPSGFGGTGILQFDRGAPRVDSPDFIHPSYGEQIRGMYVGGLLNDIPQSILFRNIADQYMDEAGNFFINPKTGKPFSESQLTRSIFTKLPASQVDDQMLQEYDFYQSLLGK